MTRPGIIAIATWVFVSNAVAGDPVSLENVVDPGPNRLDEIRADAFSMERAVRFLDSASLQWLKQRKCFTCHTNFAYLYARPAISSSNIAHRQVRNAAESLVNDRWPTKGPHSNAEVVAAAAALAFNDATTTGKLHPVTSKALDRMWTLQRDDGGWDWIKCNWAPFEHDDHYGATLALIAVGVAPNDYAKSPGAVKGTHGVVRYLKANPPENAHHRAMLLWASKYHEQLISDKQRKNWIDELQNLQKEDGGWATATLGNWRRADGSAQDTETSDGYGTGFTVFVLNQAGIPKDDPRLQHGVAWLKKNQRESGRWISRSLYRDNKHFLSHAGSAFAVMALASCETE